MKVNPRGIIIIGLTLVYSVILLHLATPEKARASDTPRSPVSASQTR
jgi:hypothetical protein